MVPNLPDQRVPDGLDENDNVELRRWWVGVDEGAPFPTYADYQRVPALGDRASSSASWTSSRARKIAGSMFPLFRGDGSRLLRALGALRPRPTRRRLRGDPSADLRADRDDDVDRSPAEVRPTRCTPSSATACGPSRRPRCRSRRCAAARSLTRPRLPIRLCAETACFRREAGAAGKDTRGLLRVHEFDKVELFAYCTPEQADEAHADILARAEGVLQALGPDLPAGQPLRRRPRHGVGLHDRPRGLQPRRRSLAGGLLGQLVPRLPGPSSERALPPR